MKNILAVLVIMTATIVTLSCEEEKLPVLTTLEVADLTYKSVTTGGAIVSEGDNPITSRGVCYGLENPPTIQSLKTNDGLGIGTFVSHISGLKPYTQYFIRAYATTSNGTGYGNVISFKTSETLKDIDGNYYDTLTIGFQTWMIQDLATSHYNDGTPIPYVQGNADWILLNSGAYCFYENDSKNHHTYGNLYNWFVVNSSKNACPFGWHVPSDWEFQMLIFEFGGEDVAGGELKETGTAHWLPPNTGATNSSGFTGVASGNRIGTRGEFYNQLGYAIYWTSDASPSVDSEAINRVLTFDNTKMRIGYVSKTAGFSIRCVKDY